MVELSAVAAVFHYCFSKLTFTIFTIDGEMMRTGLECTNRENLCDLSLKVLDLSKNHPKSELITVTTYWNQQIVIKIRDNQ